MPVLTSVATLKEYLNISGTDHDTLLGTLLDATETRFRTAVGWAILTSEQVAYRRGIEGRFYTFPVGPITALTMATLTDFDDDVWTDVPVGRYRLRTEGRIARIDYPDGFVREQQYRFTYTLGYASDAIPEDIQHCITVFAALEYMKTEKGGGGRTWDVVSKGRSDKGISVSDTYRDPVEFWNETVNSYRVVLL